MIRLVILAMALLLASAFTTNGQQKTANGTMPVDYAQVSDKLERLLKVRAPGWKLMRKVFASNHLIQKWKFRNEELSIWLDPTDQAAEDLQKTKSHVPIPPSADLQDIGDEAYLWRPQVRGGYH